MPVVVTVARRSTAAVPSWGDMVPQEWLDIEHPTKLTPREIAALAVHWTTLPGRPSAHLSWGELACNRTGKVFAWKPLVEMFENIREANGGTEIAINSAYRDPGYNSTISGASSNSPHMYGLALDCSMATHDPHVFEQIALDFGATGIGTYPPDAKRRKYRGNFIHIDLYGYNLSGNVRRWGEKFSAREAANQYEGDDAGRERSKQDSLDRVIGTTAAGGAVGTVASTDPEKVPELDEILSPRDAAEAAEWWAEMVDKLLGLSPYMLAAVVTGGVVIYWRWIEYQLGSVIEGVATWSRSLIWRLFYGWRE